MDSFQSPESSNIAGASYDPATRELTVTFGSGQTYAYSGVPAETWAGFKASGSKGAYFHRQIKSVHAGIEV